MNFQKETEKRVAFIKECLADAHANGVVFGLSGGKDSALVGILAKLATDNTLGVIMPCSSKQNYTSDMDDAFALAEQFNIQTLTVDLTETKNAILTAFGEEIPRFADINIAPRLRMTTLYALGQKRNYLVAGTSNKCEYAVGYFTKWGDGASDFNPIADLTAQQVKDYLEWFEAPKNIWTKEPSAGLFDGQTDEKDLGVTYAQIAQVIQSGSCGDEIADNKIKSMHEKTKHKRSLPKFFKGE